MNTQIRIAMAAAAVVVIAVIGFNFLPRTGGVGGVEGPASTPVPTPTPTPAPRLPAGQISPGTYRLDFITVTVPAGWNSSDGTILYHPNSDPPNGMVINTWANVATVYNDPCHWQSTAITIGPTVDNLVAALVAQKRATTVTPVDVTIDGFRGKQIDLMVPLDVVVTDCDGGQYKSWTLADGGDRYNQGAGQHDLLDILDVNGQTLVIKRSFYPANTADDLAELQAMVDSIRITP